MKFETISLIKVKGYLCNSFSNVIRQCKIDIGEGLDVVVSDLSMGVWKANQVADEIFSQLNIDVSAERNYDPYTSVSSTKDYLKFSVIAGEGIDAESLGDYIFKSNEARVKKIKSVIDESIRRFLFVVILPMSGAEIKLENESFLNTFLKYLKDIPDQLIFIQHQTEDTPLLKLIEIVWQKLPPEADYLLPNDDSLRLLPGVVNINWLPLCVDKTLLIPLKHNNFLIPLEMRTQLSKVPKHAFDKLVMDYSQVKEVHAYAQYNGNSYFIDNKILCKHAWEQFGQGAKSISILFLTKAYNCSKNILDKAIVLCQLQGLRIALWEFVDVAKEVTPSGALPLSIRRFLIIAKGWGNVMTGELEIADMCFNEAKQLFAVNEMRTSEYLYLLNISALLLFKKNQIEEALVIEKHIETILEEDNICDYKLLYVNSINSARLYKNLSQFDLSLFYFKKAFNTTLGLQQESDFVYYNLILSQANQSLCKYRDSFIYLLSASLNWLCVVFPESASKRLYSALGLSAPNDGGNAIDEISFLLEKKIKTHPYFLQNLTDSIMHHSVTVPQFIAAYNYTGHINCAIGYEGLSYFVSDNDDEAIFKVSALAALVFNVLYGTSAVLKNTSRVTTIIINTNMGFDIPRSLNDLLLLSYKLNVNEIYWEDKRVNIQLDNENDIITIHPGIAEIIDKNGAIKIIFKRYYKSIMLPQHFHLLLRAIWEGPRSFAFARTTLNLKNDDCIKYINELADMKVVKLS